MNVAKLIDQVAQRDNRILLIYQSLLKQPIDKEVILRLGIGLRDQEKNMNQCISCKSEKFVYDEQYDWAVCKDCGVVQCPKIKQNVQFLPDTHYKIRQSEYKRIEYFERVLETIQAKRIIDDYEMISSIRAYINQKFKGEINYYHVQKSLRPLGYKQNYLWIPSILQYLQPEEFSPIQINYQMKRRLCILFVRVMTIWDQLQTKRKSLLSYHFILFKLSEIVEYPELQKYIRLPRGKRTMKNLDIHWDKVIAHPWWSYRVPKFV